MPNAKVGAMPQPNNHQNNYPPGRGTWRNRTQQGGGLSIEDLKRQTAQRLAQEGEENADAAVNSDHTTSVPSYQRHQQQQQHQGGRHNQHSHNNYQQSHPRPQYGNMPPNPNAAPYIQQQQDYTQQQYPTPTYSSSQPYPSSHRHYTDSQLGLGGRGGGAAAVGQPQQYPPMRSPVHSQHQQQQQYGTPSVSHHESALKDRGSAENSDASEGGYNAQLMSKGSYGSNNSTRHNRHDDRNVKPFNARGMQSPDGRRTPVRDGNVHGQKIIFSPNQRDMTSTPTSVYSEPPRNRSQPNSPHNMQQQQRGGMRGGYRGRSKGGGHYNKRHGTQQNQQQSKLPHGLTVQELKEMTRARLAADSETAEVSSVHSVGTHGSSSQSGSMFANVLPSQSSEPLTRNLVQTNDSIRHTQSYGAKPMQHQYQQHPQQQQQQQQRQYQQYPNNVRHPSPVFGAAAPSQFNGAMQSPRQISPLSEYQGSDATMLTTANSGSGGTSTMPFSSPMSWAGGDGNSMVNRSRCHSAEASPLRSTGGVVHIPLSSDVNRRRCLTTSPMAKMDRVNEDKPFWFTDNDKDRLAIPQLAQRPRLHSASSAFSDSAFQPIGKAAAQGGLPFSNQMPKQLSHSARLMSMESQGHGDLPSSMAEAVLNSLTGAPPGISLIGGDVIGSSPFRPLENKIHEIGDSPFRALNANLLSTSASGSESMFSNGESNRVILETHSWGGGSDEASNNNNDMSLSHDFNSLLNIGEQSSLAPMRGRANTEPPPLISSPLLGFPRGMDNSGFHGQRENK